MSSKKLKIIPLGGLGEIGKNMMVYEYENQILVVDAGIMFPDNDMLGIDYILPDFQYLKDNKSKVVGIVITHGHEDHVGAISHLLEEVNAPIYATKLTCGFVEMKLARKGLLSKAKVHTVQAGSSQQIGPFNVEFCHVSHSIPDTVALGIETPAGLVVHTGDYKFDQTPVDNWPADYSMLADWASRGVLAMLGDSTNSDKPGWTESERVIDPAFDKIFNEADGRILVVSFASLISRMQQVAMAASRNGRKVAFVGRSMQDNSEMAMRLGYLNLPDGLVVTLQEALNMVPNKVALLCTGSQGEPTSIMGRLASGKNRQFDLIQGDTIVFSSHHIPGNEESVFRTINRLFQRGAKVIYEQQASVHVSGHANQEEMKLMLNLVKPKHLIPVHGELRQLHHHAELAIEAGMAEDRIAIIENGQVIEFNNGRMKLGRRLPGGYIFVDGAGVGDIGPAVVREREALARDGVVIVDITLDKETGEQLLDSELITKGFIHPDKEDDFWEMIDAKIESVMAGKPKDAQRSLEKALNSMIYKETKRRPKVFAIVNEV